ncbi:MAG: hypothetical protein CR981_00705 [Proteobacteria bacterium]|nr:MAG: hypothetical protein CR981_00705 [Pseudomonadota bacterium]
MIKELAKKAMFTGIGMISLTKDAVEEVARGLVEKGKLSEQEGKKLVEELMEKSEESKSECKEQLDSMIQKAVAMMDIASKEDIERLRREVAELREQLSVQ